jgi:hypothetical protein
MVPYIVAPGAEGAGIGVGIGTAGAEGHDVVPYRGEAFAAHHAEGLLLEEQGSGALQSAPTHAVMGSASASPWRHLVRAPWEAAIFRQSACH